MTDSDFNAERAETEPDSGAGTGRAGTMRFAAVAALFFLAASVVMTWPLAVRPDRIFSGRGDYYLNTWNLWWVAQATAGNAEPGLFETDRLFHPVGASLEGQPLSLLQTVSFSPITLAFGPVVAFNLLVLLSFVFAGWIAALWARELTGDRGAALVAGSIFAFAPYHYTYLPELNLVAIGVVPLYFLAALGLTRRPGPVTAVLAGVALAAVALTSWYYGIAVGLAAAALTVHRLARGTSPPSRRVAHEALHWAACALCLVPVLVRLVPAFAGASHMEGAERTGFSWVMEGFKGTGTTVFLPSFAGWVACGLALVGASRFSRAWPLVVLTAVFGLLSLGDRLVLGSVEVPLPYALLSDLPFVGAARYPDRFFIVAQLGLAGLAALGVSRLRSAGSRRTLLPLAATLVVLLEFWPGPLPSVERRTLPVPETGSGTRGAVLHWPTTLRNGDGEMMFHQVTHGRAISGGYLTRPDPQVVSRLRADRGTAMAFAARPAPLGEDFAAALAERGYAYVCVQRAPLAAGAAEEGEEPGAIYGPFSLGARHFLRERLFPSYPVHGLVEGRGGDWEREVERRLGPPLSTSELGAVFSVPSVP